MHIEIIVNTQTDKITFTAENEFSKRFLDAFLRDNEKDMIVHEHGLLITNLSHREKDLPKSVFLELPRQDLLHLKSFFDACSLNDSRALITPECTDNGFVWSK